MHTGRMVRGAAVAAIAVTMVAALSVVGPALAVTARAYATWTLAGAGGAYTGTMTLAPGFPGASFTSNSRASADLPTGASTWIPSGTPFGAVFGSSEGRPYVNLRPAADNAVSPSTTTYTFAEPIPPGAWGFALGDIDADQVQVSATDAAGNPVAAADLGFQSAFNYCDASPRSSTCSGVVAPFDMPTWTPAATSGVLLGNVIDTTGAAGWFRPTVALTSLTFVFTWQSGQPIYQTWFASLSRSVTGTVTHDGIGHGGVELTLTGPDGTTLATTTTAADGTYHFDGYGAVAGYTVAMVTPAGLQAVGPTSQGADLTTADAVANFALTTPPPPTTPAPVTYPVTGVVTDVANAPVPGVNVMLAEADGTAVAATTTDQAGRYTFPAVPAGDFRLTIAANGTFQGAAIDIQVPLATGEVAPIVLAAQPPTETVVPELPATGRRSAGATSLAALIFLGLGAALTWTARRRVRSS